MKYEVFTHTINNKKAKVRNVIITLLLTLLVVINGFAQQFIDIVNAPLNPVGYIENKNQLYLKGDIAYLESEEYLNFDKNGNRLFLYYNFLDKEKARETKSTYLELDNQKRLVYKENFFLEVKTFYTYNPNGTIAKIEVQSQYPSVRTFEYDNNKRMIKQTEKRDAKTTVTDYAYQTNGNRIVISASETVTENNQITSRTYQYTYENGLMMKYKEKDLEDTYTYTYDTKGNWLTKSSRFGTTKRQLYYHSELGEWDKWSWKYVKDYAWLPYLTVGNREVYRLNYSSKDLDNFTDVLFFEPITGTTLVAENVVTANGLSQGAGNGKVSVLKAKNLMYKSVQGNIKFFVEGNNKSGNIKQVFVGKTYVIYDASSLQTYWCRDFEKGKKFNVFEDLGKDAFLWYKSEKNDFYFWQKGDYVTQALGYTLGTLSDDDNLIIYQNQKPVFVIENLTNSIQNTFYKAVPYSGQPIPKNNSQTTTTTGSNTSEQTTETRYYNGKYTKETALKKANDFFNLKNGEKITFTKIDKKSDYQFIGNWIIKSEAENLQSKIEYLFEDDGLKIKINEIVLNDKYGALKMDKNHKDEVARKTAENLYVSINDLFVKAVFAYLDIANNTTQTTTTAGSTSAIYTAVQPNTTAEASSLVAFSKNKPLYFKKITNAQVQFYQDETKITPPEKFFKSHSGDLIAYYEPGYYYIFSNVENATLNTIIKPNYQIANDFYYEVLSKDKTYVNRKGKYLKLSDFKLYVEANDVLNFMFPEEDVTYTSNMGNGPLYSKYYSGGKFKGTDYLDIKKDKSFDLIRRGVRIPKSDYEVKVDIQNDNQAFIYYKGKKEFKISNYKSFFEQAYLRPILRVQ